jgi:putative DNA primase/helicase
MEAWEKHLENVCLREKNPMVQHIVASRLLSEYVFATIEETNDVYVYENGVYHNNAEALISTKTQEFLVASRNPHRAMNNLTREVIGHVKRSTMVKREEFDNEENIICMKNGYFDMNDMTFHQHDPKKRFMIQIPIEYKEKANCPKIDIFFSEIVYAADQNSLYEIVGLCIWKSTNYNFQKAIMLHGQGCNGKSVYLSLLKSFLGQKNISARTLQELENNRFALACLRGKLANVFADLPSKALSSVAAFKSLTGGDYQTAEVKYGKHAIDFVNTAKLIFSANTLPETFEETDAFFRRWHIITFPNSFEGRENPKLISELTTPEEMSGLFLKAIAALKHILAQGKLSNTISTAEMRTLYLKKSSPVQYFIEEMIVEDANGFIQKEIIHAKYMDFCRDHKLISLNYEQFAKKFRAHMGMKVSEEKRTIPEINMRKIVCVGIRIKEENKNEEIVKENMNEQNML